VVVWNDAPTKYVVLTGSYIPQKVVLRSIGTNTTDPLRIYNRNEIDKTGRVTTEGVLTSRSVPYGSVSARLRSTITAPLNLFWLGRAGIWSHHPVGFSCPEVPVNSKEDLGT
jgi:hypothetical protein